MQRKTRSRPSPLWATHQRFSAVDSARGRPLLATFHLNCASRIGEVKSRIRQNDRCGESPSPHETHNPSRRSTKNGKRFRDLRPEGHSAEFPHHLLPVLGTSDAAFDLYSRLPPSLFAKIKSRSRVANMRWRIVSLKACSANNFDKWGCPGGFSGQRSFEPVNRRPVGALGPIWSGTGSARHSRHV